MCSLAFESLSPTTITAVVTNTGNINLDAAFSLLPITRVELPTPKRSSAKFKIPFIPGMAGAILSLRYKGSTRGIIRSVGGKHFRNSITTDVACKEKNVSAKISASKVQLCGATSIDQCREVVSYVIQHLLDIQDHLDLIQSDLPLAKQTIEWLQEIVRGEPTYRFADKSESSESSSTSSLSMVLVEPDFLLQIPNLDNLNDAELSDGCPNKKIAAFFLRYLPDFAYWSSYIDELKWILDVKEVATRDLAIEKVITAMVNYNFSTNMLLNRFELARRINGLNGFFARYDNSIEHNVTIHLPYEVPEEQKAGRKKNKAAHSTILVYLSGLVTLSSPTMDVAKNAYDLFNNTIGQLREHIYKEGGPRTLKYKPVWKEVPQPTSDASQEAPSETGILKEEPVPSA